MRTCIRCKQMKDETEFNWRNIQKGHLQSVCKACQAQDSRERNRARVKESNKAARERGVERAQAFVYEYLSTHHCADCGISDIAVLTFHHTDAKTKRYNVSDMISHGYALETIQGELDRCIVLCWNCHMRREQEERGKGKKFWVF
jgi:hypothetical protein